MKKLIFKVIRLSGLPFLFREIVQKNKVSILLFHDMSKENAEKTFTYLSKKYNIIHLNDFIHAIEKKDKSRIPKKALILTFDDGHIGNYDMLHHVKKTGIPVSIFLCASIVNTNRHFWFKIKDRSISIPELKNKSNRERLSILSNIGFEEDKEYQIPHALQKVQIDEMKPHFNLQSHTLFHPILPQCNFEEARKEIFHSKQLLEEEFDLDINAIAYPNGDYSERDLHLAKAAGYKCGITVDFGFNTIHSDLYTLKRFSVNDTSDINELIVKASGLWAFLKTKYSKRKKIAVKVKGIEKTEKEQLVNAY